MRNLYTVKQAAEFATVSASTIYRDISAGVLPTVKVRGCTRILGTALLAYLGLATSEGPDRNWDAELLGSSNGDDSHAD